MSVLSLRARLRARDTVVAGALAVAGALLLQEVLTRTDVLPARWFPPVSTIFVALSSLVLTPEYWSMLGHTLRGWGLGLVLAAVIGVPAGMLIGSNERVYRFLRSTIEFLRPIPSVALIPVAILVYGRGLGMKVFLVTFAALWPILFQALYGIRDVDPVARDTCRAYGLPALARFRRLVVPTTAPFIATGLRISSSIALILAITAELVAGAAGLGSEVAVRQSAGALPEMYALIVTAGLLGWGLNEAFRRIEAGYLHWHIAHREGTA
jgi:ABC-type nitrate/sulfonate/bicarbonate transport system permease component